MKRVALVLVLMGGGVVAACSSNPSATFHEKAQSLGLLEQIHQGVVFTHMIYENRAANDRQGATLNVWLGSDGTPWTEGRFIATDPTPARPVLLEFVANDNNAAIYLGRPCYHKIYGKDPQCSARDWTSGRYSNRVVQSLTSALQGYAHERGFNRINLIGYSGGGALAMLMAPHMPAVKAVVTLAGNHDHKDWTRHHGFQALEHSLNPAEQPALPESIRQLHLIAMQDRNIRPAMINRAVSRQHHGKVVFLKGADHACCWGNYISMVSGFLSEIE